MKDELTGAELAQAMAKTFNTYNYKETTRDFVDEVTNQHRTLQQATFRALLKVVEKFAENHRAGQFDGRNEAACQLADKIYEAFGDDFHMPFI